MDARTTAIADHAVTIRAAEPADARQIAAVKQQIWSEEAASVRQIRRAVTHPDHVAFVAQVGGDVVGTVVPEMDGQALNAVRDDGDHFVGRYHWWLKALSCGGGTGDKVSRI